MAAISVRAHAKINLALSITATRPDGFHELRTVFQSLALHDTVTCRVRRGPLVVTCDDPAVPTGPANLVWRAAARLWEALGRTGEPHGVEIAIQKRIPMQAGLGGGSADATAALLGLRRAWEPGAGAIDLHPVAAAVGADAAYFLIGGTALGLGRGEELYPLQDAREAHVVLGLPAFGVSTADAYRWYDEARAAGETVASPAPDRYPAWPDVSLAIDNHLEPPVAWRHPEIGRIREALAAAGAEATAMTGSGSAVFGLFPEAGTAAHAASRLAAAGWRTLQTRTLGRAAYARLARPGARRARDASAGPGLSGTRGIV